VSVRSSSCSKLKRRLSDEEHREKQRTYSVSKRRMSVAEHVELSTPSRPETPVSRSPRAHLAAVACAGAPPPQTASPVLVVKHLSTSRAETLTSPFSGFVVRLSVLHLYTPVPIARLCQACYPTCSTRDDRTYRHRRLIATACSSDISSLSSCLVTLFASFTLQEHWSTRWTYPRRAARTSETHCSWRCSRA
jgi:hypothetical protein